MKNLTQTPELQILKSLAQSCVSYSIMVNHIEQGGNFEPKNVTESIDTLLDEIHAILDTGPFQSEEEKDMYLHKLYSLLAASNNTRVHDMIQYIRENYGEWER